MKTPISKIPSALKTWTEKSGDFWLGKCIRSLGYTRAELADLMKTNEEIDRAVKLAFDSLFEKIIHNIATDNISEKVGDLIMLYYGQQLNILKKADAKDFYLDCPKNGDFNNLVDDEEEDDDDDENENDIQPGEFLPLFKKIKIKKK